MTKSCQFCKTDFTVENYRKDTAKYCSRLCHNRGNAKNNIGRVCSDETRRKIGLKSGRPRGGITMVDRTCLVCEADFSVRLSYVKRGDGIFCSVPCRVQMTRGKKFSPTHLANISGPNASNWQGGKTTENQIIRHRKEYRQWRINVYERDDYTCQMCFTRGGTLNADHIKPFSKYPELRFELSNGRTLCAPCHRTTDTFGHKINRPIMSSTC